MTKEDIKKLRLQVFCGFMFTAQTVVIYGGFHFEKRMMIIDIIIGTIFAALFIYFSFK